jgi:hypothetical protein
VAGSDRSSCRRQRGESSSPRGLAAELAREEPTPMAS